MATNLGHQEEGCFRVEWALGPSEEKAVCARGCIGHRDGGILVATRAVRVLKRAGKLPWTGGRAAASKLRYQSPDMGGEAPESAMWARAPTWAYGAKAGGGGRFGDGAQAEAGRVVSGHQDAAQERLLVGDEMLGGR